MSRTPAQESSPEERLGFTGEDRAVLAAIATKIEYLDRDVRAIAERVTRLETWRTDGTKPPCEDHRVRLAALSAEVDELRRLVGENTDQGLRADVRQLQRWLWAGFGGVSALQLLLKFVK